jgi:3-phenylpropionate/trans-cinnamate dioxygenase ferredoxin reductase component
MVGIVILGGGDCGLRAAFAAREQGYAQPITIIAAEPGLPYERPPLSKPDKNGVIEKPICTPDRLQDSKIELLAGVRALAVDAAARMVTLSDGRVLGYDKLLLATGAMPRKLGCAGGELALPLRTLADAKQVYAAATPETRVTVIGAGLIGMELAAVLVRRGVRVTVLEYGPRPLGRNVPATLAARIIDRHLAEGVTILCNVQIAQIGQGAVGLTDGRSIASDVVVVAIGVAPEAGLAQAAGLAIGNGICVDRSLRSTDPNIFAAGDCANVLGADGVPRRFETWQNAQTQGEIAGRNMAGASLFFDGPVWFWSDHYDLGLQAVGDTAGAASATRKANVETELHFYLNAQGRLVGAAGLGLGNAVAKDIKLAQKLIESALPLDAALLADPAIALKKMLRPHAAS